IRSDNGTEFKNNDLNQFCGIMGIKREFSVPRTPQQNGIAERKNMTLIEATRTMLADSRLPIPFWAEAVNTAYPLGKFKGNVDEGFLVGYSNNDGDAAFDGKEHDFDEKKPESEVNVSPSSSAYNEVNAAGSIVPTVMKDSSNSSNTISAAGSSVSLTVLVKLASYTLGNFLGVIIVDGVYSLTRFEDLGEKRSVYWWLHLRLEDITYSDDEDDVVKQKKDGIFISQAKYTAKILRKFGLTKGKSASTPIDTKKPLLKDLDGEDVDVHTYRSMISSLMYLTSSRPNIMFAKIYNWRMSIPRMQIDSLGSARSK
nr:putative ribonuclease H-like domain-containing protein [Tanacetum cinerariifolium]